MLFRLNILGISLLLSISPSLFTIANFSKSKIIDWLSLLIYKYLIKTGLLGITRFFLIKNFSISLLSFNLYVVFNCL